MRLKSTTPGRLHAFATFVLLIALVGSVSLAQAGLMDTPVGGWGSIDAPQPTGPRGDGFQIDGASGAEN